MAPVLVVKPDTIKPGPYFPVYPGSWWQYKITDSSGTVIETYSVSATYLPLSYCYRYVSTQCTNWSDTVFVPGYKNEAIFGYKKLPKINTPYPYGQLGPIEFISEKTGTCSIRPNYTIWDTRTGCNCIEEYYTFISKTKIGNDSVLIATGSFFKTAGPVSPNHPNQVTHAEFVKFKGLTDYWIYDTIQHDTLKRIRLLSCFVNQ